MIEFLYSGLLTTMSGVLTTMAQTPVPAIRTEGIPVPQWVLPVGVMIAALVAMIMWCRCHAAGRCRRVKRRPLPFHH